MDASATTPTKGGPRKFPSFNLRVWVRNGENQLNVLKVPVEQNTTMIDVYRAITTKIMVPPVGSIRLHHVGKLWERTTVRVMDTIKAGDPAAIEVTLLTHMCVYIGPETNAFYTVPLIERVSRTMDRYSREKGTGLVIFVYQYRLLDTNATWAESGVHPCAHLNVTPLMQTGRLVTTEGAGRAIGASKPTPFAEVISLLPASVLESYTSESDSSMKEALEKVREDFIKLGYVSYVVLKGDRVLPLTGSQQKELQRASLTTKAQWVSHWVPDNRIVYTTRLKLFHLTSVCRYFQSPAATDTFKEPREKMSEKVREEPPLPVPILSEKTSRLLERMRLGRK